MLFGYTRFYCSQYHVIQHACLQLTKTVHELSRLIGRLNATMHGGSELVVRFIVELERKKAIISPVPDLVATTDSALKGSAQKAQNHINVSERTAALFAVKSFTRF